MANSKNLQRIFNVYPTSSLRSPSGVAQDTQRPHDPYRGQGPGPKFQEFDAKFLSKNW